MMAALFLLMTGIIGSIYFGKRIFAIGLLILTVGLCWLMLGYHATTALKVVL